MVDIANLSVQVQVNLGNLNNELSQVQKATSSLQKTLQQATGDISGVTQAVEKAASSTAANMQKLVGLVSKVSTSASAAGRAMKTTLTEAAAGIGKIGTTTDNVTKRIVTNSEKASTALAKLGTTATQSFKEMSTSVRKAGDDIAKAAERATAAVNLLNQSTTKVNASIRTLSTAASGTATAIQNSFTRIDTGARQVAEAVAASSSKIATSFETVASGLRQTAASANQAAINLASHIHKAQQVAKQLGAAVQTSNQAIQQSTAGSSAAMRSFGVIVGQAAIQSQQGMQQISNSAKQANTTVNKLGTDAERILRDSIIRLEKAIRSLQSSLGSIEAALNQTARSMASTGNAANQASSGLVNYSKKQQDVVSGSANLGRFMRVLTTNIFGVNAAAIALGTALGNLATQMISRVVLGAVQIVTQFGRLRNELAASTATMNNAGRELAFITEQAVATGQTLDQVTTEWIQLAEQARRTGVDVEKARQAYSQWNTAVQSVRQRTIVESFRNLGNAIGEFVVKVDRAVGASNLFTYVLDKLTEGVQDLSKYLPNTPEISRIEQVEKELEDVNAKLQESIELAVKFGHHIERWRGVIPWLKNIGDANAEAIGHWQRKAHELNEELIRLRFSGGVLAKERNAQEQVMFDATNTRIQAQLSAELDAAGKSQRAKEKIMRLHELENQFRSAGIELTLQEKIALNARYSGEIEKIQQLNLAREASMAFAAQDAQFAQERLLGQSGLLGEIIWSWDDYAKEVERANASIRASVEETYQAELQIAQLERQLQKQKEQAMWDVVDNGMQALNTLFPQSKAVAYATAIVNTAEAVTKTLATYGGTPWGWAAAAAVAASGAAQIAAIARAKPNGGGSLPRPSNRSSSGSGNQAATPAPGKAIEIVMNKGDIWSAERVAELIDRINEQVGNGKTMVATRVRPA